jgi:ribosome-binding factor A
MLYNNKASGFFRYQRLESLYHREIAFAVQDLVSKDYLPACSITKSSLSTKGENLKVYLLFTNSEEKNSLSLLNKRYLFLIKRHLIHSKKFSRIPQITFHLDEKSKEVSKIEKIIKEISNNFSK